MRAGPQISQRHLNKSSSAARKSSARTKVQFFICLFAIALAWGCSPASKHKLIVGMELAYPPFEMTDPQNQPAGISADLAKALAESLGQELQIQNLPFDGLIPALKTGKIDLILSSMTATTERAQSIDFSDAYLKTGLCLLVGKKTDI